MSAAPSPKGEGFTSATPAEAGTVVALVGLACSQDSQDLGGRRLQAAVVHDRQKQKPPYVQRELTAKLQKEGFSAEQALKQLEPCGLSLYRAKGVKGDAYVLPQVGRKEMAVLHRLGLTRLREQRKLGAALAPRSEFVPTEADETA